MLGEVAIKFALSESLKTCAKFLKEHRLKLDTTAKEIEESLTRITTQINNWSKEISFSDLKVAKLTSQVFIEIDISLMPRKTRIDVSENIEKIPCKELFTNANKHIVILGQPGAGKTTLMKFLCQSIMLDENFYPNLFKLPIIIRLRELEIKTSNSEDKNPIISYLFESLGLVLTKDKSETIIKDEDLLLAKERVLFPLLENISPLIILDGYDEIPNNKAKEIVLNEFKRLTLNLNIARVMLTSRSSEYNFSIENTMVLEICPLDDSQIKMFATKWLGNIEKADDFFKNLKESPFADTAIRPLALSHLCAIFERVGKIPDKPKTVYKKIINLLLEEWDEQRSVKRISSYGNFEIDRKFDFLCRLAFEITTKSRKTIFNEIILKSTYEKICFDFGLLKKESDNVVKELEGHTGLIIQSGYNDYEFAHKSIHEFLCAEYLVKLPNIPNDENLISLLPNEFAIATTISSNPSLYFCELIFKRFYRPLSRFNPYGGNFIPTFVNRLVLEKPDFNLSKDISFALVVLYTLLRGNDTNPGQLRLFESELPIHFERFVELIFERNKKFEYKYYYNADYEYQSETKDPIIKLTRNYENPKDNDINYKLPDFLYVKESFIESI